MRTITPGQGLKEGEVSLSAFWNGTPMFSHNISIGKYNELVLAMKKDFIDPEDVEEIIEHLNQVEEGYFQQSLNHTFGEIVAGNLDENGEIARTGYVVDLKEGITHLLLINDLVNNKKVIPSNDKFGLLVMTMPKKSSARTGNSNQTPKKKKRK